MTESNVPGGERLSPRIAAALALGAVALVIAVRAFGYLQVAELAAYDQYLRWRNGTETTPPISAVVSFDDRAFQRFGWPVPDEVLDKVIKTCLDAGAVAVGIDLYREDPQPPGSEALEQTFKSEPRVIVIYGFSSQRGSGSGPPPTITSPARIGFADMLRDDDQVVRRGLLFLSDETKTGTSLALQTVQHWLQPRGIAPRASADDPRHMQIGEAVFVPLTADFGGYQGADAAGYQYLFDYRRQASDIPTIAANTLLDGDADASVLKDRLVFVGTVSETVKDQFVTPLDTLAGRQPTTGVYLHALAADQIARAATGVSRLARALPDVAEWALVLVIGMVTGLAVARGSRWTTDLAIVVGLFVVVTAVCYGGFLLGWWLPVVPLVLASVGSTVLVVAAREFLEQRQRTALSGLLENQVSPAIARALWENRHLILDGARPKPTRLDATVLFVDLEGSTDMADALKPDVLVNWVGRFLEEMAEAVVAHDGVIEKFTGDGLMAVFGVPVPRTSAEEISADADAAVACAAEMARRLDALNARSDNPDYPHTRCRVGIHSGPLSSGNVGTRARMQYTVIGQPANLAARLEAHGKDIPEIANDPSGAKINCRVLLSEATRKLLRKEVPLTPMGSVTLRGAQEPMAIFRLDTFSIRQKEQADA